ncbi:MAG: Uncharacterized protein FD187_2770 [bacterium]|nr:MAG: Uncharacterized protein FD142_1204 [bacterium]KAF0147469.1 MAG: Uncharacterized protein FD187_2770 [bacterium]KAF0166326.1 MAG: Uncharacterized protein FD158_2698 [bacterium]TXT18227.1 MAG: Uncharacterized protein FD132_2140 [bacterium]
MAANVALLPDAGPLITLAYADALELLCKPGWPIVLVDMVLHEVTRNQTPTSEKLAKWAAAGQVSVRSTRTFQHHRQTLGANPAAARTANLGELAIQETMNAFALEAIIPGQPRQTGVFLFEDHKIARASFLLPDNCRKISTRAYLLFLKQQGWLESAADIERRAIQAGRSFSKLRFPPE